MAMLRGSSVLASSWDQHVLDQQRGNFGEDPQTSREVWGCCKNGSCLRGAALLPYVPRVPPAALPGKLTATTFALERPCCVFDRHANASDAVWLVVAFANASDAFRNPPSRADVPLYERLPTARSYMTLEMAADAYACSAPSPAVLRVGGDTACADQGGCDSCNGPLPSPGPYRVKFLVMGCQGPKAETRWSDPILLRRGTGGTAVPPRVPCTCPDGVPARGTVSALCRHPKTQRAEAVLDLPRPPHPSPFHRTIPEPPVSPPYPSSRLLPAGSPSTIDPAPARRGSDVVVITSILASLGTVLAAAVLGAVGTEAWRSLCRRDSGTGTFAHRSYRTHHIPPALPQPLPPGCRCSPPGLGCFAPRPPGPCPAE
ncbi:uroplakin-3b [Harpia harpyja]|uniref:uroplakin-3b n=1 Tax=Harpia harpyja TaxID=202280 RepID=UPI0022B10BC1|nr:uroplakin-3b [Harpia harpyja]